MRVEYLRTEMSSGSITVGLGLSTPNVIAFFLHFTFTFTYIFLDVILLHILVQKVLKTLIHALCGCISNKSGLQSV